MRAQAKAAAVALTAAFWAGACAQVLGIEDLDVQPKDASVQPEASAGSAGSKADGSPDGDVSLPEAEAGDEPFDAGQDREAEAPHEAGEAGHDALEADVVEDASCGLNRKLCSGQCVSTTEIAWGCAGQDCTPCMFAHASALCETTTGLCALAQCAYGYDTCDGNEANGCETSLKNDPAHCGTCGTDCAAASFQNTVPTCLNGACVMGACIDGWTNCDNNPINGCEVNTGADVANCGGCGKGCAFPHASATCVSGVCTLGACDANYADCNTQAADGCEVYTSTDSHHCGTCTTECAADGGSVSCKNGQCTGTGITCTAPMEDCDGNTGNGCETDLSTSVDNCGACGAACDVANGTASCSAGKCQVASCKPGYGDCDSVASNGCETATSADPGNCGSCGNACPSASHATPACVSSSCALSCESGFGDCTTAEGCETELGSDPAHCGACSAPCLLNHATPACSSGLCVIQQCANGYSDCDLDPATGCEWASSVGDALHCGGCGRVCSTVNVIARSCATDVCDSYCVLGFANCNLDANGIDDGCETDASQATRCGSCTNDCTKQGGGFTCANQNAPHLCSCADKPSCGGQASTTQCLPSGVCKCSTTTCKHGESCVWNSGSSKDECTCNGAAACKSGETCCQTPAGCKDLTADPLNCGGCGHACPPGFKCSQNGCACNGNTSCDAGAAGTCANNVCNCGSKQCKAGERCLPDGSCG